MPLEAWEHAEAARHEVGHGIVHIVLGIGSFHQIVILREPDALGRFGYLEHSPGSAERRLSEPEPEPSPPEVVAYANDPEYRPAVENMLRRYALFCYAGIGAQCPRTVGSWYSGRLLEASTQDRRTLSREFARWGRELDERNLHGGYLRDARRLVDGLWGPLEVGADALLARLGTSNAEAALSEAELRAILAATPRTRNPWRECQKWERRARLAAIEEMLEFERERERERAAMRAESVAPPRAQRPRRVRSSAPRFGPVTPPAALAAVASAGGCDA